jgi:outer membrane receptor for ferrienterochelin and colicins
MKRLIFLIFGSVWFSLSFAQVSGSVFEFDRNKKQVGLPNAIVQIKRGEFTNTDTSGNFSLLTAKKGDTLIFSLTGYKTESVILKSIEKPLSINLSSGIMLNEVEIAYRTNGTDISYMNAMKLEILNERSLMKAACCNLSESFETNPSIDVNFADAVTGTKQIQMLGLSGQYAQITKENMPYMRGLANGYGLTFIPGTWIKSIQLSKGAGSVVNGYESFTGQINTELHDPATMDKFTFNTYVNQNGRNEYNIDFKQAVTKHFSTNWLAHASFNPLAEDHNNDGFADIPTGQQFNVMKKWNYENPKTGFEGKWGASYLQDNRLGGQISKHPIHSDTLLPYYIGINNEKWELFSKTGYVFQKKPGTSMGLQLSYLNHAQNNYFGTTTYNSLQKTFYANYIFQGILKTTNNTYKIGASYMDDDVSEKYQLFKFYRREQVAGAFAELAVNVKDKFNMVAGFRADHHNYYGVFYTPRLHLRYAFTKNSVLRLSGGRALRTANIFADNANLMASSRQWILKPSDLSMPYGLKPEIGWNYGLNFTQRFKINYREAYITFDAYRTDFVNQVVIDLDNDAQEISIYNLKGPSYSNTAQFEFNMEPRKRLFVKTAYRYVDTRVTYTGGLLQKPMVSTHRAFINLSYETRDAHWQFDFTTQFNGAKRLPNTQGNPVGYRRADNSPNFYNLLGQITYLAKLKRSEFHIYVGVENLLNYKQTNPIVDSHSPYNKYFDASMVWGPIYGRMLYAGLRFKIKELTWLKFKEDK